MLIQQIISGKFEESREILVELLDSEEFDTKVFGNLALQLFSVERYQLAALIFRRWTEIDVSNPEPWSNLGLALSRYGELHGAKEALLKALAIDSRYPAAVNNLAGVYQFLGEFESQLETAVLAVEIQPGSATALNNLGTALIENGRLSEAKTAFERSVAINPEYFEAAFNLARVASDEGKHHDAIDFLESSLDGQFAKVQHYRDMIEYHLSFEYLTVGRLREGWNLYERGFSSAISPKIARTPNRKFIKPMWDGRPLQSNERLMIWREQGVGDEIRFAALLPSLSDSVKKGLIVECDDRLVQLFERSLPGIEVRSEKQTVEDFDFHLPIGSLPRLLMSSAEVLRDAPALLQPDSSLVSKFTERLNAYKPRKIIGICWRSHKLSAARNKKYTALEDWYGILSTPGAVFVNLQYGECEAEILEAEHQLGIQILRWKDLDLMNDFSGVAALVKSLDLVISVSAAVVPLAGAVGTPTVCITYQNWVLLGEKHTYPWFFSVTPVLVHGTKPVSTALPFVQRWITECASQ